MIPREGEFLSGAPLACERRKSRNKRENIVFCLNFFPVFSWQIFFWVQISARAASVLSHLLKDNMQCKEKVDSIFCTSYEGLAQLHIVFVGVHFYFACCIM